MPNNLIRSAEAHGLRMYRCHVPLHASKLENIGLYHMWIFFFLYFLKVILFKVILRSLR